MLLMIGHGDVRAQIFDSMSMLKQNAFFDVPGPPNLNPDETLEYLDELSTQTGRDLERLHANADISWSEARRELRAKQHTPFTSGDSSGSFSLRSRIALLIDPDEQSLRMPRMSM